LSNVTRQAKEELDRKPIRDREALETKVFINSDATQEKEESQDQANIRYPPGMHQLTARLAMLGAQNFRAKQDAMDTNFNPRYEIDDDHSTSPQGLFNPPIAEKYSDDEWAAPLTKKKKKKKKKPKQNVSALAPDQKKSDSELQESIDDHSTGPQRLHSPPIAEDDLDGEWAAFPTKESKKKLKQNASALAFDRQKLDSEPQESVDEFAVLSKTSKKTKKKKKLDQNVSALAPDQRKSDSEPQESIDDRSTSPQRLHRPSVAEENLDDDSATPSMKKKPHVYGTAKISPPSTASTLSSKLTGKYTDLTEEIMASFYPKGKSDGIWDR